MERAELTSITSVTHRKSKHLFRMSLLFGASFLIASCGKGQPSPLSDTRSCYERYGYTPGVILASQGNTMETIAQTPPMGFNGFNSFGYNVSESLIRQVTDSMASNCMREAGYQYINLDEGWQSDGRDETGHLKINFKLFPLGIKPLADYVHTKGFKFGIYTSVGGKTCSDKTPLEGSLNHETTDIEDFSSWEVDYLKVDWCPPGNDYSRDGALALARRWHDAISKSGRPMVLSISNGGGGEPWSWPSGVVNMWRIGPDVKPTWNNGDSSILGIIDHSHLQESAAGAGPQHWSDPDMLEVGNRGLTDGEAKTQFSIWAITASPLVLGNDVRNMPISIQDILLNKEVIAIDQDKAGVQGKKIQNSNGMQVWKKELSEPNSLALAFLNTLDSETSFSQNIADFGLGSSISVRDLWQKKDLEISKGTLNIKIPAHGTMLVKVMVSTP